MLSFDNEIDDKLRCRFCCYIDTIVLGSAGAQKRVGQEGGGANIPFAPLTQNVWFASAHSKIGKILAFGPNMSQNQLTL